LLLLIKNSCDKIPAIGFNLPAEIELYQKKMRKEIHIPVPEMPGLEFLMF